MWLADPVTQLEAGGPSRGLSDHIRPIVLLQWRQASAWREWGSSVWSCGCWCFKKERRVGSDISTNPPLCCIYPLLSAPLHGSRGAERTAGVSCYHANSPGSPPKTHGSQLRGRECLSQRLGSFLCYPTLFNCELAWQWTALIMAAAGGDAGGGEGEAGAQAGVHQDVT